jgi:tRNA (cytidine/uridine-2'-O-)-methyltransferase
MALSVALIEPQIPPNTGNIARLCAATDTSLHLVGKLGFGLDNVQLGRAGLDYWDAVDLWVHPVWPAFRTAISRERCLYFSSHGSISYLKAPFNQNSVLVFGNEGDGMPGPILRKYPDRTFRIPMGSAVRSLNLATAVGIVLYEAIRQLKIQLDDRPSNVPAVEDAAGRASSVSDRDGQTL